MKVRVFYPLSSSFFSSGIELISITDEKIIHYLSSVLRFRVGSVCHFFDQGCEIHCTLQEFHKKKMIFSIDFTNSKSDIKENISNINLAFSIIKYDKIVQMLTQATELGVKNFIPLITERSAPMTNFKKEKILHNTQEALEQCGGFVLPVLHQPLKLEEFLEQSKNDVIICGDTYQENLDCVFKFKINDEQGKQKIALIGPEGGTSKKEAELIDYYKNVYKVQLGNRVMRAETAAIAILSLLKNA
jgi:16S rRNA (uracil1498-N3)-methyltransferase